MKITLELFASLMPLLPPGSSMHAAQLEVDENFTLNNLIDQMKILPEQAHLVLVNGIYKGGVERDEPCLRTGDKVSIWPPVAGG
ncbi:MAG: MoaD/ThiS family protein [Gammaproteobacteria bacterium]|nr:MoaD/ThiS family protein [Gammaproteobacteria bacterium]